MVVERVLVAGLVPPISVETAHERVVLESRVVDDQNQIAMPEGKGVKG